MTRIPHFQGQKVKRPGHQAAILTAVLANQAAAAVGVGTCWPWETAATLPSARPREPLRRPRGKERGRGISWRPPAYSLFTIMWQKRAENSRKRYSDIKRGTRGQVHGLPHQTENTFKQQNYNELLKNTNIVTMHKNLTSNNDNTIQ